MDPALSPLDWTVVGLYLLGVACVGFVVGRRQESTKDYFLGGRSIPWWAATLSIIATETSAVTFIGFPRAAYAGDWSIAQLFIGFVFGRIFLALVFVRVFYRSEHVTVYGFLADRFGQVSRTVAATLFVLGRLIASGVRLFAGCLAVHVATGIDVESIIVAVGVFGGAFTLLGGIRAVVWTDVILGLTLLAGGLISLFYLLGEIPGGLNTVLESPRLAEKTAVFFADTGIDSAKGLVCGLVGGFVLTLATHGTDQDIAQRMLTCRNSRSGSLSVIGSAVLLLPLVFLFLAVGTLLWFFMQHGDPSFEEPPANKLNQIFPLFLVHELPKGLAGLVMAGLLAAALSSFTSVLNALAATTIGDFYKPLMSRRREPARTEEHYVNVSRIATAFWGLVLIGAAIAFVGSGDSIIGLALKVLTYSYGGLLGAFTLGILTKRGSDASVVAGMLASVPVVLLLQLRQWVDAPASAPGVLTTSFEEMSIATRMVIQSGIPNIGWPYWIVIGTALTMAIGALGTRRGQGAV
jgi:SSS family transporter